MCNCNDFDKLTLIVKPTHDCNLNCPYCYDKQNRCDNLGKKMPMDMVEKILKVFNNNVSEWIWHGGEPLLMGHEWLDKATSIIKENDSNIRVEIQSNGTLIDDNFIEYFKKYNMRPGLSFDGIKNELTRKSTGRLLNVFNSLEKNKMRYGCIMVLTPISIHNIIEEYEYGKRTKIHQQMNLVFKAEGNDGSSNMDYNVMIKEIIKFYEYWIHDKDNPYPSELCIDYLNRLLGGRKFCSNIDCTGKWFAIHPNGDIYPCGRDWDESMCFGNILNIDSKEDILKSEKFIAYKNFTKTMNEKCDGCEFKFACNSGCYGTNYLYYKESGMLEPEPNHCKSTKAILTYIYNSIKNIDINNKESMKEYNPVFIHYLLKMGFRNMDLIKEMESR